MILEILNFFDSDGISVLAPFLAFAWGVFSVVLCPCHLAALPLIAGIIDRRGDYITLRQAFVTSLIFTLGLLLSSLVLILLLSMPQVRTAAADFSKIASYCIAALMFYLGMDLLDLLPGFLHHHPNMSPQRKGYFSGFFFGAFYGLMLGPCTLAFMSPLIAYAFRPEVNVYYGLLLMFMFVIGNGILILLAGTFRDLLQKFLRWNAQSRGSLLFRKLCGILIIIAGFYILYLNG